MTENNKESLSAAFAHAAANLADPLGMFAVALMMGFMFAALRWDGHLYNRQGCFQIQVANGQNYKVDTCEGKTEPLALPANSNQPAAK